MSDRDQSAASKVAQTVHATPIRGGKKEATRFERFKDFFVPRLRKQEELGVAYEEAKVRKVDAEGERLVAEAAKLSAERDLVRQQELRTFCKNVDEVFNKDDSAHVTALKFAKLLETNPTVAAQLEKVNAVLDRLHQQRSCQIEWQPERSDGDA